MPLHEDTTDDPLNLTDDQYKTKTRRIQETVGDEGLHIIPEDIMLAALARAKVRGEQDG